MNNNAMPWQEPLLDSVRQALSGNIFWSKYLSELADGTRDASLHLAVFVEPFLTYVLKGQKTIESRFSVNMTAPHGCVDEGDVLILKKSGGAVLGVTLVTDVWFYELDPDSWDTIRTDFAASLCATSPDFWDQRARASYATLMRVTHVERISPVPCAKKDRRGWVVLKNNGNRQMSFATV